MSEGGDVFHYISENLLWAYRQAEKYLSELNSSGEMEIKNTYEDTLRFEGMLFRASYAAIVFSDPRKGLEMRLKVGGIAPGDELAANVYAGVSTKELRKLYESYALGNRKITRDQLNHIIGLCLELEGYIGFMNALPSGDPKDYNEIMAYFSRLEEKLSPEKDLSKILLIDLV